MTVVTELRRLLQHSFSPVRKLSGFTGSHGAFKSFRAQNPGRTPNMQLQTCVYTDGRTDTIASKNKCKAPRLSACRSQLVILNARPSVRAAPDARSPI